MSRFYKPDRKPDWNYGGLKWRLSRSKIDLFMECPRCFYVDNKLGTPRPPGFPFNLNSAVDALLKKEFDIHRTDKTPHPLMQQYGVEAIPFQHEDLDEWRENFKGVCTKHAPTGFTVCGAVDDIWVNPAGELIVVDYKSTSKDATIDSLDEDWHDGYKRQMEVYQWLLRQNGFTVADTGYFVYANASKAVDAFDNKLEFELTLIPYEGKASWIDGVLEQIKACLDSGEIPKPGDDCDYCTYREFAGKKMQKIHMAQMKTKEAPAKKKKEELPDSPTLF